MTRDDLEAKAEQLTKLRKEVVQFFLGHTTARGRQRLIELDRHLEGAVWELNQLRTETTK